MSNEPVIAIVDDDKLVCEATVDLLEAMGFVATASESAEDFLKSSHLRCASCLITDMQMGGMTGLELHAHMIRSGNDIPTILITAFPNDADRTRALQAGIVCYLVKPFDGEHLLGCIRESLEPRTGGNP